MREGEESAKSSVWLRRWWNCPLSWRQFEQKRRRRTPPEQSSLQQREGERVGQLEGELYVTRLGREL